MCTPIALRLAKIAIGLKECLKEIILCFTLILGDIFFCIIGFSKPRLPNGQMLNRWLSEKNNSSVFRLRFHGA